MATFERSIKIDAPVDRVWAMMTNPATWGSWFPDCDQVTGLGTVEAGATFQWQDEGRTGSGAVTELDTSRGLLKVVVRDGDREVSHTFDLDQAGGFFGIGGDDTTVKYRKEYDAPGGFLGEFVAGGNPVDALDVKKTLERIRNLAQSK